MSEHTNQTQQSTFIPDSLSNTPWLTKNSMLFDTDELVYIQYFERSNDIIIPINNNNIHSPYCRNNIQDLIPPLIGSLGKVSSD